MSTKKNYDSEFCGSLPLHQINLIQPYGCLLVLDKEALNIIQLSENAETLFGQPVKLLVDTPIANYIAAEDAAALKQKFSIEISGKIPFAFHIGPKEVLALAHGKDKYIILEIEQYPSDEKNFFLDVYGDIRYAMAAINATQTITDACSIAIKELKKLSGFDRIMMYQFDEEWNGTVIAEEMAEGMNPYLGLKFPASDVPKQARDLYLKNPYRLIPNREYTPVRLYPVINPVTQSFIDLSDCNLRSVAAVHLEYLKNMGVTASMSTRVIKDGKLWGLISCHHRSAKYLNYEVCSVFELLSEVISGKISSLQQSSTSQNMVQLQQKHSKLVEYVYAENDLVDGLLKEDLNISNLFGAGGSAIAFNGRLETKGDVPSKDEIENLLLWLQAKNVDKVFSEPSLATIYDHGADYADIGSGILAIPINAEKGDYIISFRPEAVSTVNWGGNPDEAINFEPDRKNYHPRNSFKLWQQVVKQTSVPWTEQELAIAESLRGFLFEYSTKHAYN